MSQDMLQTFFRENVGDIILVNLSAAVTSSVLYGPYIAFFILCVRELLRRQSKSKSKSRSKWILLCFMMILFIFVTAGLVSSIALLLSVIRATLIKNAINPVAGVSSDIPATLITTSLWVNTSETFFFISDAIIVWRVWVIWPRAVVVKIVLLLLALASLGISIAAAATSLLRGPDLALANYLGSLNLNLGGLGIDAQAPKTSILSISTQALYLPTVAINVVATILFSCKAYQHRKRMEGINIAFGAGLSPLLAFLAESGAAFCVLQVISLVMYLIDRGDINNFKLNTAITVWQVLANYLAAVYPMLVIALASQHPESSHHRAYNVDSDSGPPVIDTHVQIPLEPLSSGGGGSGTHLDVSRTYSIEKSRSSGTYLDEDKQVAGI